MGQHQGAVCTVTEISSEAGRRGSREGWEQQAVPGGWGLGHVGSGSGAKVLAACGKAPAGVPGRRRGPEVVTPSKKGPSFI